MKRSKNSSSRSIHPLITIFISINPIIKSNEQRIFPQSIFYSKTFLDRSALMIHPNEHRVNLHWIFSFDCDWNLADPALYLIIGSMITIGCLMIIITAMLCLYGYYKCRRREFRLNTERQTLKFRTEIDSYRWLGQQPSTSSSSPYLIQSTSI